MTPDSEFRRADFDPITLPSGFPVKPGARLCVADK